MSATALRDRVNARLAGRGTAAADRAPAQSNDKASLALALAAILVVSALLARIGADAQWLVALGHTIVAHQHVPLGVPFASATSAHWHNPLVLAEITFYGLQHVMGDRGLVVAQLIAVGIALASLARDALGRRAGADAVARVLLIFAVGSLPVLAVVRVQLFSLALFPVLVCLLRAEARSPSRRLWLAVPVVSLWANLHGAALIGLATLLSYLALHRAREDARTAVGVALASIAAVFLTPALSHTIAYYHGVLTNVAATRGVGLWSPLRITAPLDDLALATLIVLGWRAVRAGMSRWEWAVLAGLALLGAGTSRSIVWLAMFLVAPAACSVRSRPRRWGYLAPLAVASALAAVAFAIARGPMGSSSDDGLLSRAVALARGTPILAPDIIGERVALRGGRIWLGNPLDAFRTSDQARYLDWAEGRPNGLAAVVPSVHVVLVEIDTAAARLMARDRAFTVVARDSSTELLHRTR